MDYSNRPALKALIDMNVEVCRLTGAGKGADTTQEALKAYSDMFYQRRAELADLIINAEQELRNLPSDTPRGDNGRFYIEGMRARLERETRPR